MKPRLARAKSRKEIKDVYRGSLDNQERENELAYQRIKDLRSAFYGGIDPRRRQEMADSGMIEEDPRAMSNLPTKARHMQYPSLDFYSTPYIDDMTEDK